MPRQRRQESCCWGSHLTSGGLGPLERARAEVLLPAEVPAPGRGTSAPGGKRLSSSRAWPLGQEDTTPLTPGCELCPALPCSQLTQTETGPGVHFTVSRLSCQSLGCQYLGCEQLPFICPAGKAVVMRGGLRLETAKAADPYSSLLYSKLLFSSQNLPKALFLWKTSLTSGFYQSSPPLLMGTWV